MTPSQATDLQSRCDVLQSTWSGALGLDMAGDVMLPGPGARIASTTFDDWLAGETSS
jgi:hypothetical protein